MKLNLQDVFSKADPKKSLVIALVAIVTVSILCAPVYAWDPDQHIGMGNIVLDDLLYDSTPGIVTIKGVDYKVSQLVYDAISSYPQYYKFGCIGPDGFPDIVFGQCAIHPGYQADESTEANVYSYAWFDHMLSQVYSQNDWEMSLKAIAFTYGFMSHAAGDIFCHTFTNRYTGGVWSLPTNGLRHVAVEAYVDGLTGWKDPPTLTTGEYDSFSGDTAFRNWIYTTLIDNSWARAHTSGGMAEFYEMFLDLRDQLDNWISDSDWWTYIYLIPPVPPFYWGYTIGDYLSDWRDDINDGLRAWVGVSTEVAYSFFILGDTDRAINALKDWYGDHLLSMLGTPDWIAAIIDAVGHASDWIVDRFQWLRDLIDEAKDFIFDWGFKLIFGVTLDDLKDFLKNPANYLDSPLFDATPDAAAAPFHPHTREAIDNQLAVALQSGSFNPWAFDATYNTIMMMKLLLLDGAGLNKLLADNGVGPLYTEEEGTTWQRLAQPGMCVMRGFMKSLDSDHQWMSTAPDGVHSYGIGTPLWENIEPRERVFKKIFHLGLDMDMTPTLDLVPGQTGTYDIKVINTENTHDTFALSVDGLPTLWSYQLSANTVELDAGASEDVTLDIVPYKQSVPHSTPSTAPGDYPFTVTGNSIGTWLTYDLVPSKMEYGNVHVLPYYEPYVEITPATSTTKPGGTRVYTLEVSNFGNVPDRFSLALQYVDFGLKYRAVPTAIQASWTTIDKTGMGPLDPGAFDTATLTITVPSDWAGMENAAYQFNVIATSLVDPHNPPASTTVSAELVVQATKESMARYIDLELHQLLSEVQVSGIKTSVKVSLLANLDSATTKKELALTYILAGNNKLANNALKACYDKVNAFSNAVKAQRDKHLIPTALANKWIAEAKQIITDLRTTITKPI